MNTVTFNRGTAVTLAVVAMLAAAGVGYGVATWRGHEVGAQGAGEAVEPSASASAARSRQVLYWYDPMKPDARFDKPGKSPFMDMQLVPKYADEAVAGGVQVDPRLAQSLGLRLATVARENVSTGVDAVGTIGFNERDVAIVQTRAAGFVERVYARAPGDVPATSGASIGVSGNAARYGA